MLSNLPAGATNACPICGHKIDTATALSEGQSEQPKPGDVSVCGSCAVFLIFTNAMRLRLLKSSEFIELPLDLRICLSQARQAIRELTIYN
jgi:hypothetical protein